MSKIKKFFLNLSKNNAVIIISFVEMCYNSYITNLIGEAIFWFILYVTLAGFRIFYSEP